MFRERFDARPRIRTRSWKSEAHRISGRLEAAIDTSMIRYLTPRPASHNSWKRFLTYPDPDGLVLHAVPAEDFSRVVSSIRIGHMHKLTGSKRLCQVDH